MRSAIDESGKAYTEKREAIAAQCERVNNTRRLMASNYEDTARALRNQGHADKAALFELSAEDRREDITAC